MTTRSIVLLAIVLGFAGLCYGSRVAHAGDGPHDRATLQGLTAVFVDVQPLDATGLVAGLEPDAIKSELDLKLRLAGLTAMRSADEDVPPQQRGVLQLNVGVVSVPKEQGVYAYSVYLGLLQGAVMIRDMQTVVAAPTWWVVRNGVGDVAQVRGAITAAAERFVTAYRSAIK